MIDRILTMNCPQVMFTTCLGFSSIPSMLKGARWVTSQCKDQFRPDEIMHLTRLSTVPRYYYEEWH